MRDVNYGFLLRYFHANGASLFFYVFIFILGEVCYGGYLKAPVWRVAS